MLLVFKVFIPASTRALELPYKFLQSTLSFFNYSKKISMFFLAFLRLAKAGIDFVLDF